MMELSIQQARVICLDSLCPLRMVKEQRWPVKEIEIRGRSQVKDMENNGVVSLRDDSLNWS